MKAQTGSQDRFLRMIGQRVQYARNEAKMTQENLSDRLGFKDRQILSNIESGKRKISAEEMVQLMRYLQKPLEFFTDPFLLVGEQAFCWRSNAEPAVLDQFEEKASQWIVAYRALGEKLGKSENPTIHQLPMSIRSSYEEAWEAAEKLIVRWGLDDTPASHLLSILEDKLDVLVLFVEAPLGISGAACHLGELNAILINRWEPDGRRAYNAAHELFHLLTWQTMEPDRLDILNPSTNRLRRIERLAENFAGSLLMPREKVHGEWHQHKNLEIHKRLNRIARNLKVTSKALKWRLKTLGILSESDLLDISDELLTWNGQTPGERNVPKMFSYTFLERFREAISKGVISVRRTAGLLDCTIEDLSDMFRSHKMEIPFDL